MENQQSYKLGLASAHHIRSFDYIYEQGLSRIMQYLQPMELHELDLAPQVTNNKHPYHLPFTSIRLNISHL